MSDEGLLMWIFIGCFLTFIGVSYITGYINHTTMMENNFEGYLQKNIGRDIYLGLTNDNIVPDVRYETHDSRLVKIMEHAKQNAINKTHTINILAQKDDDVAEIFFEVTNSKGKLSTINFNDIGYYVNKDENIYYICICWIDDIIIYENNTYISKEVINYLN